MSEIGFHLPIRRNNSNGKVRRLGYELEFAGVDAETAAGVVADCFDGKAEQISQAEYSVETSLGKFRVELDWNFGRSLARRRAEQKDGEKDVIIDWMTSVAEKIVPVEVVCPPIGLDQLVMLNPMVSALREQGAIGTEQSFLYAFGLHLNPELPDFDAETIIGYVQAFVLCQDWLVEQHNVDISRRITPFINVYPMRYASLVMNYDESTTVDLIIADYLQYNASRNRALDLLPLFKHLDSHVVDGLVEDDLVKARPTFHYRLPNCEIERPNWRLDHSWNLWGVVEQLAHDNGQRQQLILQWREHESQFINFTEKPWHQTLDAIHQNLLSA